MVTGFQHVHELPAEAAQSESVLLGMHGTTNGMWGGMGWMMWLLMMLFWLLILVALAGGVYWLFSHLFGDRSSRRGFTTEARSEPPTDEALRILNERYARGEIDDEEYTRRKRKITEEHE